MTPEIFQAAVNKRADEIGCPVSDVVWRNSLEVLARRMGWQVRKDETATRSFYLRDPATDKTYLVRNMSNGNAVSSQRLWFGSVRERWARYDYFLAFYPRTGRTYSAPMEDVIQLIDRKAKERDDNDPRLTVTELRGIPDFRHL